jgi:hypothetical protein
VEKRVSDEIKFRSEKAKKNNITSIKIFKYLWESPCENFTQQEPKRQSSHSQVLKYAKKNGAFAKNEII